MGHGVDVPHGADRASDARLDLLCVLELGHVQLDSRGAELLVQVLTEREEKDSVALASNLSFIEWGQIITDARLVAAVIDRVTFNAHIVETGTDSYRHRTSRTRRTRSRAASDVAANTGRCCIGGLGAAHRGASASRIDSTRSGTTRHHIHRPRRSPTMRPASASALV